MTNSEIFNLRLKDGIVGESTIAEYWKKKGYNVLPIYEKEINEGKGPRLFCVEKQLIAPDMFIFNGTKCFWIEAKHKTAFSWHRLTGKWVTGIDLKHYGDYCEVDKTTPWPVWLLFLHRGGQAKDSPPNSPVGLFGNSILYLQKHENHRHSNWGKTGMVYWSVDNLILLDKIYENIS